MKANVYQLYSLYMKPVTSIILKHAAMLILTNVLLFWLWFYSPFRLPRLISGTPINIHGIALVSIFVWVLIRQGKQIIKMQPAVNLVWLTASGTLTCFIAEIIIQLIRAFTSDTDKLLSFLLGVISMTIFCAFISFFVAYQLKTKNTRRLVVFIIGFMVLCKLLLQLFPSMGE